MICSYSNGHEPEFNQIEIVPIIQEVIQEFETIDREGRKVELRVEGDAVPVWTDQKLFGHVLRNMVSNAFKFSPDRPSPELTLTFGKDDWKVTIKDHGIGISKEDLKSVFDPFLRAKNAMDISGSGLGTAIVIDYMNILRGTIDMSSEEGRGTIVTLSFPFEYTP